MPYIQAYKPKYNYQHLLHEEVYDYLNIHNEIEKTINHFIKSVIKPKKPVDLLNIEVDIPDLIFKTEDSSFKTKKYRVKRDYYSEELKMLSLVY